MYVMSADNSEIIVNVETGNGKASEVFMKSPRILGGLGDTYIIKECKHTGKEKYDMDAELIDIEYENTLGETVRQSFSGVNSYRIQSTIAEASISR